MLRGKMKLQSIKDVPIEGKKILIRVDYNVPMEAGKIKSFARIDATLETIKYALNKKTAIIIISHMGQPKEGSYDKKLSLEPISQYLSSKLKITVSFKKKYLPKIDIKIGE